MTYYTWLHIPAMQESTWENMFWLLLMLIAFCLFFGLAAMLCDWLEHRGEEKRSERRRRAP